MMLASPAVAELKPKMANEGEDLMNAMRGSKGGLAQKLANAIIARAAQKIGNDMTCTEHRGQPIVAFD